MEHQILVSNHLAIPKRTHKLVNGRALILERDHIYAKRLQNALISSGMEAEIFHSLLHLGSVARIGGYHLVIMAMDLPEVGGLEIGEYMDIFFRHIPAILVVPGNMKVQHRVTDLPSCIKYQTARGFRIDGIMRVVEGILGSKMIYELENLYRDSLA